jgi:hypothetical protein
MIQNLGTADRIIRAVIALFAIGVYFSGKTPDKSGYLTLVGGIYFAFSAIFSFCILYRVFGFRTCPLPDRRKRY